MAAEHAIDHLVRRRLTQSLGCAGQLTQRPDQATEGFGIERVKRRCPCLRTIACTFFPVLCQRFQRGQIPQQAGKRWLGPLGIRL
ncbi:MAG: hypothetical protein MRY71_12850 [Algiphilus sp.]|nr:hypothetical protein [Algiphilus sp.]